MSDPAALALPADMKAFGIDHGQTRMLNARKLCARTREYYAMAGLREAERGLLAKHVAKRAEKPPCTAAAGKQEQPRRRWGE
jgi:hypothetical protein